MHLWDDTKGYLQLPYKKYAYVKNRNGQHISLYGDRLKRVTGFDKDDPTEWILIGFGIGAAVVLLLVGVFEWISQ